ncbi:MAG TPA: hypothetical protein VGN80_17915 [Devosiaceae bacterium]|jgi:hypothetical protein|nr:hypothetical protein [Devosiaceae bacterium]
MRDKFDRAVTVPSARAASPSDARWLQAGFSSFAYRLAHPALPRPFIMTLLLATFYFA